MKERMRKVNEVLREVVAEEVRDLVDPRLGFVTITAVDTSPDLRTATVFYSVLGEDDDSAAALKSAAPRIQAAIGRQVRMKYTPRLTFEVDEALAQGQRINELLHSLAAEDEPEEE